MGEHQSTVGETLEAEHRWIDQRLETFQQQLAQGQLQGTPFQEAAQALRRHIFLEEEVLFPEVEARGLMGPTEVMVLEHGEICRLLDGIQELLQRGVPPVRIQNALKALFSLLEEHNFKEERALYPAADRLLDRGSQAQVLHRFKEARPPEGWVCRAARGSQPEKAAGAASGEP